MRLFHSNRPDTNDQAAEDVVNLCWQYEISEDDGKTWRPEMEADEAKRSEVRRRGTWVPPYH